MRELSPLGVPLKPPQLLHTLLPYNPTSLSATYIFFPLVLCLKLSVYTLSGCAITSGQCLLTHTCQVLSTSLSFFTLLFIIVTSINSSLAHFVAARNCMLSPPHINVLSTDLSLQISNHPTASTPHHMVISYSSQSCSPASTHSCILVNLSGQTRNTYRTTGKSPCRIWLNYFLRATHFSYQDTRPIIFSRATT